MVTTQERRVRGGGVGQTSLAMMASGPTFSWLEQKTQIGKATVSSTAPSNCTLVPACFILQLMQLVGRIHMKRRMKHLSSPIGCGPSFLCWVHLLLRLAQSPFICIYSCLVNVSFVGPSWISNFETCQHFHRSPEPAACMPNCLQAFSVCFSVFSGYF